MITERIASQNIQNKLVSQRFTDIVPQVPLLYAADYFKLPQNISTNINTMQIFLTILRLTSGTDPDSITLVLLYDNNLTHSPGEAFFTKTVRAPNNPPIWRNTTVGERELISLNISQGEVSGLDGETLFDLSNTSFLPRETRLWMGFYVTGPRAYIESSRSESVVFWCTTDKIGEYGDSIPYFYIDESDILKRGFINWTNASVIEKTLGLNSFEKHMAWSLDLLAVEPSTVIEMIQSLPASEIAIIVVSSLVGLVILVCCSICICKRCRRCRMSAKSTTSSAKIPIYDLTPVYDPLSQGDDALSVISLETSSQQPQQQQGQSASIVDKMSRPNGASSAKRSASGQYLQNTSYIPLNLKTSNSTSSFDKDK